jgi:DNA-directed RNA polymerase specialized sigma24 family protein
MMPSTPSRRRQSPRATESRLRVCACERSESPSGSVAPIRNQGAPCMTAEPGDDDACHVEPPSLRASEPPSLRASTSNDFTSRVVGEIRRFLAMVPRADRDDLLHDLVLRLRPWCDSSPVASVQDVGVYVFVMLRNELRRRRRSLRRGWILAGDDLALVPAPEGDEALSSAIRGFAHSLPERELAVLDEHFLRGSGVRETGRLLRLDPTQVRRCVERIRWRAARWFDRGGICCLSTPGLPSGCRFRARPADGPFQQEIL